MILNRLPDSELWDIDYNFVFNKVCCRFLSVLGVFENVVVLVLEIKTDNNGG